MAYKNGFFGNGIIATVRNNEDFQAVIDSKVEAVFLLWGNIFNLEGNVKRLHDLNKSVFVHLDFLEGFSKDYMMLDFIDKRIKPDGVVSSKSTLIAIAKELGIYAILRINVVDSCSLKHCNELIVKTGPDALELTPGIIHKVTKLFKQNYKIPIITGGLIESRDDVISCLHSGADAIATSNEVLWATNPIE